MFQPAFSLTNNMHFGAKKKQERKEHAGALNYLPYGIFVDIHAMLCSGYLVGLERILPLICCQDIWRLSFTRLQYARLERPSSRPRSGPGSELQGLGRLGVQ